MAFASVQHCVSELDTISVLGQIQCRARGTPVRPTELTKSLAAVLSNIVKEKIEVHDLWLVGCYLHPFFREMQSISDMDRRREYRMRAESMTKVLSTQPDSQNDVSTKQNNCSLDSFDQVLTSNVHGLDPESTSGKSVRFP